MDQERSDVAKITVIGPRGENRKSDKKVTGAFLSAGGFWFVPGREVRSACRASEFAW